MAHCKDFSMEDVTHRMVQTYGVKLHIAELGQGPLVMLLHGFPEFWYSWRRQMPALANAGFHVVALDLRGYGESDKPSEVEQYDAFCIVGDLVGLLDALGVEKALIVAHDMGAVHAWDLCLLRPDRVAGLVCMSSPYFPRDPKESMLTKWHRELGDSFYVWRNQKPGVTESACAAVGTANYLRSIFKINSIPSDKNKSETDTDLPDYLSEEELAKYTEVFEKHGFTGALNHYRNIERNWQLKAPWTNAKVRAPTLFIIGALDKVNNLPGVEQLVQGKLKEFVPNLEKVVMLEDGGHFIQQECWEDVNGLMLQFFSPLKLQDLQM